jgi:metal-responsive CopG/Arc/MetJ family transcriptional regulator
MPAKAKRYPKPAGTFQLNMNMSKELFQRLDKYRFQHMFAKRSEAIAALLDWALKQNPQLGPKGE